MGGESVFAGAVLRSGNLETAVFVQRAGANQFIAVSGRLVEVDLQFSKTHRLAGAFFAYYQCILIFSQMGGHAWIDRVLTA